MDKVRVGKPKKNKTTGEFKVPVYINGKYSEEDTYYTNDMSDAMSTMKSMIATYSKSKKYELVEASKEFEDDFGDEEMDEKPKKKKSKKSKKEDDEEMDDEDFDDEEMDDEDDKPKKKKKKAKKSKKEDDEEDDEEMDEPDTMKEEILRLSNIIE